MRLGPALLIPEPPYRDFLHVEQAKSPKIRLLFDYWRRLHRDGKPGLRTSFDPVEVPSLLSSLLLGDIESDPFRVFFRLIGTAVAEFSRLDFSGYYLDALDYKDRDSIEWRDCYLRIHTTAVGLVGFNRVVWPDDTVKSYEFAILPLSRDDHPAGSFVSLEDYDGLDARHIPDMPPVTVFQRFEE
jgi:hypothetical protein